MDRAISAPWASVDDIVVCRTTMSNISEIGARFQAPTQGALGKAKELARGSWWPWRQRNASRGKTGWRAASTAVVAHVVAPDHRCSAACRSVEIENGFRPASMALLARRSKSVRRRRRGRYPSEMPRVGQIVGHWHETAAGVSSDRNRPGLPLKQWVTTSPGVKNVEHLVDHRRRLADMDHYRQGRQSRPRAWRSWPA